MEDAFRRQRDEPRTVKKANSYHSIGEHAEASVAPSDGELFLRTHKALWCIGAKP